MSWLPIGFSSHLNDTPKRPPYPLPGRNNYQLQEIGFIIIPAKNWSKKDELSQVALTIIREGSLEIGMQSQLNDGNQTKNLNDNQ